MKLMAVKMNDKEAEPARPTFVFSCFAGLAISDMENLEYKYIQTAADEQVYIREGRQKTKVELIVPSHPITETIISYCQKEPERNEVQQTAKEKGDHLIFHRDYSHNIMDARLSIVGKACGTCQGLSYCMIRYTFDTMDLSAGMPIENITKMMRHASVSSIQVYVQVTDGKISEGMNKLITK